VYALNFDVCALHSVHAISFLFIIPIFMYYYDGSVNVRCVCIKLRCVCITLCARDLISIYYSKSYVLLRRLSQRAVCMHYTLTCVHYTHSGHAIPFLFIEKKNVRITLCAHGNVCMHYTKISICNARRARDFIYWWLLLPFLAQIYVDICIQPYFMCVSTHTHTHSLSLTHAHNALLHTQLHHTTDCNTLFTGAGCAAEVHGREGSDRSTRISEKGKGRQGRRRYRRWGHSTMRPTIRQPPRPSSSRTIPFSKNKNCWTRKGSRSDSSAFAAPVRGKQGCRERCCAHLNVYHDAHPKMFIADLWE